MRVFTDTTRIWDYNNLTEEIELPEEQYIVYPEIHGKLYGWAVAHYTPPYYSDTLIRYPGVIQVNGYFPALDLAVDFARYLEGKQAEPEPKEELLPGYYREGEAIYFDQDLKDDIQAKNRSILLGTNAGKVENKIKLFGPSTGKATGMRK